MFQSPDDEKETNKKTIPACTKGVAMSFGFKKRPVTAPSITGNAAVARRLADAETTDSNGNENVYTDPVNTNLTCSGRSTPRLVPPKKEANATRVSRFGFRQPAVNRLNKIADVNLPAPRHGHFGNNNLENVRTNITQLQAQLKTSVDANKNKTLRTYGQPQTGRFTLQSTQLPKPQLPERVVESKTAKTLANNNRKMLSKLHTDTDSSSKEGSVTEDSGVGSQASSGDTAPNIELLDTSPTFRFHRYTKPRTLEVVVSGKTFDVRDYNGKATENNYSSVATLSKQHPASHSSDIVHQKATEYQNRLNNRNVSSKNCNENVGMCERSFREPNSTARKSFVKRVPSPFSSDDCAAGEAMADDVSCCFSSSDESRDTLLEYQKSATNRTAVQKQVDPPVASRHVRHEMKNIFLLVEDSSFEAVAAASNSSALLEDETSPTDSLMCSSSEVDDVLKRKTNSKDVNEKLSQSPPSPGTPTNVSLSLSEGKDFFVDDEIADQPALVFDDTVTPNDSSFSNIQQLSDNTSTVTPKSKRKSIFTNREQCITLRPKKIPMHRAGSVDTLSPCESIASDDLMLDFEYSQNSVIDDGSER